MTAGMVTGIHVLTLIGSTTGMTKSQMKMALNLRKPRMTEKTIRTSQLPRKRNARQTAEHGLMTGSSATETISDETGMMFQSLW
jgi:hypothetical protein